MGRNDAKTQRWLPNAFALRSSDWRLCGMPGRGRPRGISTLYAAVCDACRRNKFSAAHCQRQGHLAAAAGAANAAAAQPVPPGAPCAHTSHGAAPGPQQPANNPTLLPLPVSPGHVARTPRSAGQQPSAADAGVGGQNLFSSQAGSGTRPAGEASSSGTAPQGRSEADIGKDAARRQQKREGGRSSAERMFDVRFERWLRLAFELRGFTRRALQLTSWKRPPRGWITAAFESRVPIPKQLAHASWGMVANREELYMHVHFQYLHSLVRNEHIARIRRPHMAHNAAPTALLSILRRWLTTLLSHQEACSAPRYTYPRVRASAPRARALAPRRPPW